MISTPSMIQSMHKQPMGKVRNIHFIGIGGVGMSGIAEVYHNLGFKVSGSDMSDSDTMKHLRKLGIKVYVGHAVDQIEDSHVVVTSTAIDKNNVEVYAARKLRIPVVRRAVMLAELMRFRQGIAIAGTHGKTTTTSLVACILAKGNLDPTYVIGGKLNSSASHAKLGESNYLVAEADESDASFLHLNPMISIVTNIDQDHLSTYGGDFERLKQTFIEFIHNLPFYGLAILCLDDSVTREIIPKLARPVLTYGEADDADVRISDIRPNGSRTKFNVHLPGQKKSVAMQLNMTGKHNALNSLAAIAVAWELGVTHEAMQKALESFEGIGRRFQISEQVPIKHGQVLHIDDYGHHPNEIKAALQAARAAWPDRRLSVVFQPHRYTRTRDLFEDFVQVLSEPDQLILLEVYPAGEAHIKDADGRSLSRAIRNRGQIEPVFVEQLEQLPEVLENLLQDDDVFVTLGAGSIGAFAQQFLQSAKGKEV